MLRTLPTVAVSLAPLLAASLAAAQAPAPSPPADRSGQTTDAESAASTVQTNVTPSEQDYDAERELVWNSPEMREARAWLEDRSRRSRRFGPEQLVRYEAWLRQKSPSEMKEWIKWFNARRASVAQSEAVARAARQQSVEQALNLHQRARQSYADFSQGQTDAAFLAREQLQVQQQFAGQMTAAKDAFRRFSAQVTDAVPPAYSWIFPPFEKYRQWAAAAALPGDLPAGDPRNFLRDADPGSAAAETQIRLNPGGAPSPTVAAPAAAGSGAAAAAGAAEGATPP